MNCANEQYYDQLRSSKVAPLMIGDWNNDVIGVTSINKYVFHGSLSVDL